MLNIEESEKTSPFALFNLGFRPFFLLAGAYAVVGMLIWMMVYVFGMPLLPANYPAYTWHAHEMVFGFAQAVVAGFLLTAVGNWTQIQTIHGSKLATLCLLWLGARLSPFVFEQSGIWWAAVLDMAFSIGFIAAILQPVIKAKQWAQLSIVLKVALLGVANLSMYLGLLQIMPAQAMHWGLYSGLYLIVSLVMMLGRRVIPFFIEKGVDESIKVKNWKWLDLSSLVIFLLFLVVEVFTPWSGLSAALAAVLFILHSIRMRGWYTDGLWSKPLLWVLYVGYGFIVLGFALHALSLFIPFSPWLATHAFAVGGVGVVTAGMMCRVSLGHTGRNVFQPPAMVSAIFVLLVASAVTRVLFPLVLPGLHLWWIGISQSLWIAGFGLFTVAYAPMLISSRVDGRFG